MEQTATLVILKGLPCSGKTEWAERWVKASQKRVRVSWTDILATMGRKTRDKRLLAFETATHLMVQALKRGCDVVLDEENLNGFEVGIFMTRARMLKCHVEWHNMRQTVEECKRRNAERGHPVDDMEIERLAREFAAALKQ